MLAWRAHLPAPCCVSLTYMSKLPIIRRRWFWYIAVALVFVGGTWYFGFRSTPVVKSTGNPFRSKSNTMPVPVRALPATKQDLDVHLRTIGTVTAQNTVTVRSRVDGQLLRVVFDEGQRVQQGQILAEIDPVPYEIKLAQAEAGQRQNAAQLETAKADLARFRQLHAQNLVTQQQLETQIALVAEREAALAADQARVDDAKRQLTYTRIDAPISGRLGMRQVDAGNLIRPNDSSGLVVITQTKPISVVFTIPEIDLQKVLSPLRAGNQLHVEAWDRQEQTCLAKGSLKTIDNQIDLSTGTLKLKAEFSNEDERLFPNQFVNVRLRVNTLRDVTVIPGAAVQYGSRGTYVYVVNDKSLAMVREVTLGPADGAMQAISKGIQPGEVVVLEGHDRLREGRLVEIVKEDGAKPATVDPAAAGKAPPSKVEKGGGKKRP